MKIRQIEYSKQYKVGAPNFSNITVGMNVTVEYGDNEEPDHDAVWDMITREIQLNSDMDSTWMRSPKEYKNHYSLTMKIPKKQLQSEAKNTIDTEEQIA